MADLLGFSRPLQNSYSCIAAIDYITSTYSAIELMLPASRPLHPGPAVLDELRGRPGLCAQRLRADQLDHAAEAQSRSRSSICAISPSQTVGRARRRCSTIMHNTPFTDMNDSEGESQGFGYGAFESGGRVLDLLAALVPALRIDPERVATEHPPQLHHRHRACRQPRAPRRTVVPRSARDRGRRRHAPSSPSRAISRPTAIRPFRMPFNAARAARRRSSRRSSPRSSRRRTSSPSATVSAVRLRRRFRPGDCRIQPGDRGHSQPDARDRKAAPMRIRAGSSIPFHRTSRRTLMATIELDSLVKRYGQTTVVHGHRPGDRRTASSSSWSALPDAASRRRCG